MPVTARRRRRRPRPVGRVLPARTVRSASRDLRRPVGRPPPPLMVSGRRPMAAQPRVPRRRSAVPVTAPQRRRRPRPVGPVPPARTVPSVSRAVMAPRRPSPPHDLRHRRPPGRVRRVPRRGRVPPATRAVTVPRTTRVRRRPVADQPARARPSASPGLPLRPVGRLPRPHAMSGRRPVLRSRAVPTPRKRPRPPAPQKRRAPPTRQAATVPCGRTIRPRPRPPTTLLPACRPPGPRARRSRRGSWSRPRLPPSRPPPGCAPSAHPGRARTRLRSPRRRRGPPVRHGAGVSGRLTSRRAPVRHGPRRTCGCRRRRPPR